MNSSEIFNHGYVAGYNQALVDKGFMTQQKADKILQKFHTETPKIIDEEWEKFNEEFKNPDFDDTGLDGCEAGKSIRNLSSEQTIMGEKDV